MKPTPDGAALALTFDDGPDPRWTPRVLDALAAAGARATFFLIGPRATAHPALVERIAREGHRIGVHCHDHVRHGERDAGWGRADIEAALAALAALGVRPALWRAPYGDVAPWTASVAREHGLRLVGWTVDPEDWRGIDAATMFAAIAPGLRDGAVVLAHDALRPRPHRAGCEATVELVGLVAGHARRLGLGLTRLGPDGTPERAGST